MLLSHSAEGNGLFKKFFYKDLNQYVHHTHVLHLALNVKQQPHFHVVRRENCCVTCKLQTLGNSHFGHLCYSLTHCRKLRHSELKPKSAAWAAHTGVRLTWHWRSSAGGVEHGTYHTLAQALGKQGGVTRYLSKHCRRFPHSSYSDAVKGGKSNDENGTNSSDTFHWSCMTFFNLLWKMCPRSFHTRTDTLKVI